MVLLSAQWLLKANSCLLYCGWMAASHCLDFSSSARVWYKYLLEPNSLSDSSHFLNQSVLRKAFTFYLFPLPRTCSLLHRLWLMNAGESCYIRLLSWKCEVNLKEIIFHKEREMVWATHNSGAKWVQGHGPSRLGWVMPHLCDSPRAPNVPRVV